MRFNKNKHPEETFNRKQVRFLSSLSFLLGFLDAFLLYLISSYFFIVSGGDGISLFYLIAFSLIFWFLIRFQPIVHTFGAVRFLLVLIVGLIGLSAFLSLQAPSWVGAVALLAYIVCSNLIWSVMDILLEDFSTDRVSGRVRGLYLTIMNLGLLLAPLCSTKILDQYGYEGVFTLLAIGYAIVLILVLTQLRQHTTARLPQVTFLTTLEKVREKKNLILIYYVSLVLEFFYVVMIIYTPILLLERDFGWSDIGLIFTVMLVPFVLIQYPLGILADKKWGEKELLFVALIVMGMATVVVGWTRSTDLMFWAGLLFFTRLGAAAIEVLRDSYFYKQVGPSDTDIVAFFRTSRPVANVFGALTSLFFLSLFSLTSLFYLVGIVTLTGLAAVVLLTDSTSESERLSHPEE